MARKNKRNKQQKQKKDQKRSLLRTLRVLRALAAAEAARESSAADAALRQRELEERLRELLAEQRKSFEHEIAEMQRTEQARLGAEVRS